MKIKNGLLAVVMSFFSTLAFAEGCPEPGSIKISNDLQVTPPPGYSVALINSLTEPSPIIPSTAELVSPDAAKSTMGPFPNVNVTTLYCGYGVGTQGLVRITKQVNAKVNLDNAWHVYARISFLCYSNEHKCEWTQ